MQNRLVVLLLIVGLNALTTTVYAKEFYAELKGSFEEKYSEEVPVSGNVIAGVMLYDNDKKNENEFDPRVFVSHQTEGFDICLSVVSKDGMYSSHNTFTIPKIDSSTYITADYSKTKHKRYLDSAVSDNIAIKARIGSCDGDRNKPFLITSSTPEHINSKSLNLYIDSLGATDVMVAARSSDRKIIKGQCEAIHGERKTGYDHICNFDLSTFSPKEFDVQVVRRRFGRNMDAIKFKVAM